MNIVPAHVAGVKNIIMTTPPGKRRKVTANTLVAAKEAGATKYIKSVGTGNCSDGIWNRVYSKVDKIVGPGNILWLLPRKQFMET